MIYQFVHLDYGSENIFKKLKYSITNLRHTINREDSSDKIHLWCARSLGRNPAYDVAALEKNGLVDECVWEPFHNQDGEIRIQPGWYNQIHMAYIREAIYNKEPTIFLDANISVFKSLEIDEDAFYFWRGEGRWFGLPWVFQTKDDASLFLETFYNKGILDKDPETAFAKYSMWNVSMLYIPPKYLSEIQEKHVEALDWIINYYSKAYSNLYVACSCADQIVLSFLIQDIAERDGVEIFTGREAFPYPYALRLIAETEADIAGSLRILFDG